MLKLRLAALAFAFAAAMSPTAPVRAGEIEHASATVGAIDRDLGAIHNHARYLYDRMGRAHTALQWHARMEWERGAQMARSGCGQPRSPQAWQYCANLHREMWEHARMKAHWGAMAEMARAQHVAVVQQIGGMEQASYWWKNRLAVLQGHQPTVVAWAD